MGRDEFNDKNIQHPPLRFYDKHNVFWYWVLSGIMANLNEFWYYQTTYNKFCVPTYFTFLGIINIQKKLRVFQKIYLWFINILRKMELARTKFCMTIIPYLRMRTTD